MCLLISVTLFILHDVTIVENFNVISIHEVVRRLLKNICLGLKVNFVPSRLFDRLCLRIKIYFKQWPFFFTSPLKSKRPSRIDRFCSCNENWIKPSMRFRLLGSIESNKTETIIRTSCSSYNKFLVT